MWFTFLTLATILTVLKLAFEVALRRRSGGHSSPIGRPSYLLTASSYLLVTTAWVLASGFVCLGFCWQLPGFVSENQRWVFYGTNTPSRGFFSIAAILLCPVLVAFAICVPLLYAPFKQFVARVVESHYTSKDSAPGLPGKSLCLLVPGVFLALLLAPFLPPYVGVVADWFMPGSGRLASLTGLGWLSVRVGLVLFSVIYFWLLCFKIGLFLARPLTVAAATLVLLGYSCVLIDAIRLGAVVYLFRWAIQPPELTF